MVAPKSPDLAAHVYRVGLFERDGFTIWNGQWYGGHHTPGYSVVFGPLGALVGVRAAGALAAVGAAAVFTPLVERHFGACARAGAWWFAAGAASSLLAGRLPFALGVAAGLAALLALQRGRRALALALAVLATLASPVAGLFLALAGAALALAPGQAAATRRDGTLLAACALVPAVALAVAFPEGGSFPFALSSWWPIPVLAVVALAVLPREERTLRTGVLLYALAGTAALLIDTPMGGNAVRLGALFAGPVLACALWGRRPLALALLALPLLWWQWVAPVRDAAGAAGDRSTSAAYYAPLLRELAARGGPPGRLEIPFTKNHWEAAHVAPRVPLARGWERQLDVARNALFYGGGLTPARYTAWLRENAVRWVALPSAPLDYSARAESALIRRGLPALRLVWRDRDWRLYAVTDAAPVAAGPGRVTALRAGSVDLRADRPGTLRLRVRHSPYWALTRGAGCVERDGDWTRVRLARAGPATLAMRFAPRRIGADGARCRS